MHVSSVSMLAGELYPGIDQSTNSKVGMICFDAPSKARVFSVAMLLLDVHTIPVVANLSTTVPVLNHQYRQYTSFRLL